MELTARSVPCPHCGHDNKANASFCNECGKRIGGACPHCGAENPTGSRFCHSCGLSLAEPPTPSPGDAENTGTTPMASTPPHSPTCPRCGERNEPDSLYCFQCGLPLTGEAGFADGQGVTRGGLPAFALGQPCGFWVRFVAYLIDGVVALGIAAITVPWLLNISFVEYLEQAYTGEFEFFSLGLQAAYFTILTGLFATTIGKRVFRMYVVNVNGSRVGLARAVVRALAQILSGFLFGIGFLIIAFRADKRGLHDLIAGTVVIRRP